MPDITTVNVPGLGTILYADCLAGGGGVFQCSPLGEFVSFFSGLFSGVPKMLKTAEAQARLAQSQLWQWRALAANLAVWVRNGIPLSTGVPSYRAQLTGWIHGTIYNSGLGLRVQPNGYNQFSAIDTVLWRVFASEYAYSGKALDQAVLNFQRVNYVLDHPAKQPPPIVVKPPPPIPVPVPQPPPPPPPPGPPPPITCQPITPARLVSIATACFVFAESWPAFLACCAERLGMTVAEVITCRLEAAFQNLWNILSHRPPPPPPPGPPPPPDPPVPEGRAFVRADGTIGIKGSPRPQPMHLLLATARGLCSSCEPEHFEELL